MILNVYGNLSMAGAVRSWAIAQTELALAVRRAGHDIACLSTNGQASIDARLRPYMVNELDPANPTFTYSTPPELTKIHAKHIYAMTAYEASILPQGWAAMLNKKHITPIVNSTQQADMMAMNGVKAAIVPLGVDLAKFNRDIPPMDLGNDKFKFLNISIPHHRKNLPLLLRAFVDEFEPQENTALVIKTEKLSKCNYWELSILDEIKKVQQKQTPEIILISGECDNLAPLYRACQAYVYPTAAEGFSLTCLEAKACGLPIIATEKLIGFLDENDFKIESKVVKAGPEMQYHTFQADATVLQPSMHHLRSLMRYVFENKPTGGMSGNWSWDNAAKLLLNIVGVPDEDKDFKAWIDNQNSQS